MKSSVRLMAFGAMGFELAISVVAGVYAGLKVDEWLGSSPFGLLAGMLLGIIASIVRVFHYLRLLKDTDRSTEDPEH